MICLRIPSTRTINIISFQQKITNIFRDHFKKFATAISFKQNPENKRNQKNRKTYEEAKAGDGWEGGGNGGAGQGEVAEVANHHQRDVTWSRYWESETPPWAPLYSQPSSPPPRTHPTSIPPRPSPITTPPYPLPTQLFLGPKLIELPYKWRSTPSPPLAFIRPNGPCMVIEFCFVCHAIVGHGTVNHACILSPCLRHKDIIVMKYPKITDVYGVTKMIKSIPNLPKVRVVILFKFR